MCLKIKLIVSSYFLLFWFNNVVNIDIIFRFRIFAKHLNFVV